MRRRRTSFKLTALAMAVVVTWVTVPVSVAQAGLIETERVIAESAAAASRERVTSFLLREDVQAQMIRLGVRPEEAVARVAALSDAEVQRLAGSLDAQPAGQIGPPEILLIAAALTFLTLLILDLTGVTNIFPFIKKSKTQ